MVFHIILNPAGASGRALDKWKKVKHLFAGCDFKLHRSTEERSIGDICRELTTDTSGEDVYLVVIGGDGTLNEAVNGIEDIEHTLFGFIPCGTGNDMQRDMSLPKSDSELVSLIKEGRQRRCADIGELTFYGEGKVIKRLFNISSDIGFGAATCAYADKSRLKPILNNLGLGRMIYLIEAIKVCFTVKPANVKVSCGGKSRLYKGCLSAIVMNHKHEGGGFEFCPNADFTDGKLDLCLGSRISKLGYLRLLPYALKGKHLKLRGVYTGRGDVIKMSCDVPMWAHTDGEVLGKADKVEMRIIPEKLRLIV
ncbi:MAG: YegS/Rv2252/BmrU family lipid kinase [Ruminococcus sp.]|nr:YegS/Rv2252/BmrU family lipid kinase [Ruminococcus sp.]